MKISCDKCGRYFLIDPEEFLELEEFGNEVLCSNCEQNAAEAAWERHCEDFHDGDSTEF